MAFVSSKGEVVAKVAPILL